MSQPRLVKAPTGTELSCKGWQQEAAFRMLQNNLDPENAENPNELIVYGGLGKAARSWEAFDVILENAGIEFPDYDDIEGEGVDVVTGERVEMIKAGIIDPVLVTKSALKNAVSVVNTIISADCVISNIRVNESN